MGGHATEQTHRYVYLMDGHAIEQTHTYVYLMGGHALNNHTRTYISPPTLVKRCHVQWVSIHMLWTKRRTPKIIHFMLKCQLYINTINLIVLTNWGKLLRVLYNRSTIILSAKPYLLWRTCICVTDECVCMWQHQSLTAEVWRNDLHKNT